MVVQCSDGRVAPVRQTKEAYAEQPENSHRQNDSHKGFPAPAIIDRARHQRGEGDRGEQHEIVEALCPAFLFRPVAVRDVRGCAAVSKIRAEAEQVQRGPELPQMYAGVRLDRT